MPVSAAPGPRRINTRGLPSTIAVPGVLAIAGVLAVAAASARWSWAPAAVAVFVLGALGATVMAALSVRRSRAAADAAWDEVGALRRQAERHAAQTARLADVTVPETVRHLREGASAQEALAADLPDEPDLRRILEMFAAEFATCEKRRATAEAGRDGAVRRSARLADEAERITTVVLPGVLERLQEGASGETVLADVAWPDDDRLSALLDQVVRAFATSERRAAAARVASAKALGRVQAKAVSTLADLREMQNRHGEAVLGDLLKLDHSTSQLGLLTDRLALLMGGRASRAWNKPITMESILRGAMGRIAAYQRVRMHCASTAAVAGFAAEGVMHLLAELMDNAANFSPPVDEVNVYVEERTVGMVVTIEDSGLQMSEAAMRRAEKAVSGQGIDLASLKGTRLGLSVVGLLAAKYDISVSYRPSSRGGIGVVVLLPPQLLAQQHIVPSDHPTAVHAAQEPQRPPAPASPSDQQPGETTGGLPVRPRGRTMADADRGRANNPADTAAETRPARDIGARFGAFHRSQRPEGPKA
jgi:signal transduction histidine kinase